jgi:hypothetical protein
MRRPYPFRPCARTLPPFAIRHSPFVIRHSPFAIRHSPFAIRHSPFKEDYPSPSKAFRGNLIKTLLNATGAPKAPITKEFTGNDHAEPKSFLML